MNTFNQASTMSEMVEDAMTKMKMLNSVHGKSQLSTDIGVITCRTAIINTNTKTNVLTKRWELDGKRISAANLLKR